MSPSVSTDPSTQIVRTFGFQKVRPWREKLTADAIEELGGIDDLERLDAYLEELSEGGGRRLDLMGVVMLDPEGRVTALSGHGTLELGEAMPISRVRDSGPTEFMARASASDSALWERKKTEAGSTLLTVSMPSVSGLRWGTLVATFNLSRMDRRLKAIREQWQKIVDEG